MQVETPVARYVVSPQQAIWIPAGSVHRTTLRRVRSLSVFLDPAMLTGLGDRIRILTVEPVLREMLLYAVRWPIDRTGDDSVAERCFDAVAALIVQSLTDDSLSRLPAVTDDVVAAAMHYTDDHLATVTLRDVCSAVAVSERTLRRRFAEATGRSWREYLARSRMLHAMALLSESGTSVITVATAVGFDNASAFARAFTEYTGQTPTAYRKQIANRPELDRPPAQRQRSRGDIGGSGISSSRVGT
ncbi:AraC family transcriptional regulator [Nocardia sp. alder85J]|nr:AraC family transcriptional regulator [Nocardia sp. alder85J]